MFKRYFDRGATLLMVVLVALAITATPGVDTNVDADTEAATSPTDITEAENIAAWWLPVREQYVPPGQPGAVVDESIGCLYIVEKGEYLGRAFTRSDVLYSDYNHCAVRMKFSVMSPHGATTTCFITDRNVPGHPCNVGSGIATSTTINPRPGDYAWAAELITCWQPYCPPGSEIRRHQLNSINE